MKLTAKQEKFAQVWFATGNKTEAYRQAYSTKNMLEKSINELASNVSRNVKVLSRYEELVAASRKRNDTSVDTIDAMLKNAYTVAKKDRKPAAMVSAAGTLARLHGLEEPKKIEHSNKLDIIPEMANEPDWLTDGDEGDDR